MATETIVFFGIFLGCLFRTLSPFVRELRKASEKDQELKWNHRYTLTFTVSFIVALASAIIGFAGFKVETIGTTLAVLCLSFVYGVGLNSTINEVSGWFG